MNLASTFGLSLWTVLIFIYILKTTNTTNHFYGGAVSYNLNTIGGKNYANIELITNWELGKGPCGAGCTSARIGQSTKATREVLEQANGDNYFGQYFTSDSKSVGTDIIIVSSNFTEIVKTVDEVGGWEQDYMKFTIEILNHGEEKFNYEGKFWKPILQSGSVTSSLKWHLQTVIKDKIRSDTNGLNNVPRVITKPVYQVELDSEAVIEIIAVDPDGDYIKCVYSEFEAGDLKKANGIEVKDDCKIIINATTSLGYTHDAWIVVAVTLNDYNKQKITFGTDPFKPVDVNIAYSSVQFLVNILTEVKSPKIIEPTLANGHPFIIYAGATWKINVYAQASSSRTIADFRMVALDEEIFVKSAVKDDTRSDVKYVEITWETSNTDVGHHLLCISAIDDQGHDSDLLCYKLEVRANTFNYRSQGQASFIDIPSPNQGIQCEADITCLLPVYIKSSSKVKTVTVGQSFAEESKFSSVHTVTYKSESTYKATLSFSNPSSSFEKMCFNALSDDKEIIATSCIKTEILSKDPCESSPCHSSECISDRHTGSFICECIQHYHGKFCEIKENPCDPDPCLNGQCFDNNHTSFCLCGNNRHSPFTGKFCETNVNDCNATSCINNGICKDKVGAYECDCHSRYEGNEPTDCSADKCNGESGIICNADKCSVDNCHSNGVCSLADGCTCMYGYMNSENCTQNVGVLPVTGAEFLDMSPRDGELYTCFVNDVTIECHIPLYLVIETGVTPPTLTFQTNTEIHALVTLSPLVQTSNFKGITNVYSTVASIKGNLAKTDQADQYICFKFNDGTSLGTNCLQLEFVRDPLLYDKSIASVQKNADVKFLYPTLNDGSRLTCNSTERCMLIFFTEPKGTTCDNVLSPTKGVTVLSTQLISGACVTEATFKFVNSQDNKTEICFQSTKSNFQQRCYEVEVPSPACQSSPCQNDGHCFRSYRKNAVLDYQCLCKKEYTGERCQKGPCHVNECSNDAYCMLNDGNKTCMCKAGYFGSKCELIKDPDPEFEVPFNSIARPKTVECIQYQMCGFTLLAEKNDTTRPNIVAGYVDTNVELSDISVVKLKDKNVYYVNVMFKSAKEGEHLVCIQTISDSGENQDEICFKVNTVTDVSLIYGFKDRPHFIEASLPMNSDMECSVGKQCHVLYHLTIGEGVTGASVSLKKDGNFDRIYYYSTCNSEMVTGANCSVDVIIIPTSNDVGNAKQVCVGTKATSSNVEGEERCFTVTTLSQPSNEGCQKLHCKNGGFCDGHITNNPLCYCPLSYSGNECDQPVDTMSTTFLGDLSLPSDIHCVVGEQCSIPFETLIVQNETADVRFTRFDSDINSLSCVVTEYSDTLYMGVATIKTDIIGKFKTCLLTNDTSVYKTDELCIVINSVNASEADPDQSFDKTKPHFLSPTLPADSTVFCSTSKTCHLDLHFTNGDKFGHHNKCPTVIDTSETKDDSKRVLVPKYKHTECISDIVYLPPASTATSSLCVQLVLPGDDDSCTTDTFSKIELKGENRCFNIKVVSDAEQEKISQCIGGSCSTLDICQDGQVGGQCNCKVIRKTVPTEESEDSGVPIAVLAGVGSAFVVIGSGITGLIIYKLKKSSKVDADGEAKNEDDANNDDKKESPK